MSEKEINWQSWKCRCSSISKIMANSRSNPQLTEKQAERLKELDKKEILTENQRIEYTELIQKRENSSKVILSDTCIGYLTESYSWITAKKVNVGKEMDIEALRRGKMVEDESIDMLSFVENLSFEKNKERIENDFLSGEPDVFAGPSVREAVRIVDMKNVMDYPSYLYEIARSELDKSVINQLQGYGDISGAKELEAAKALCNMPEIMINDRKRKLFYQMNVATEEAPEYLAAVEEMERSLKFDDIPIIQRIYKIRVEPFTAHERNQVYDRVKCCREWLNNFHLSYQKLNK